MPEKVLVAMSGGVDSSVALQRVLEAGYDAFGVTMKLWAYDDVGGNTANQSSCCSLGAIHNARAVCVALGAAHYTIDLSARFQRDVINNFISEYAAGRTPNPCVRCNSYLKWDALLDKAAELGATRIATGHYARIGYAPDTGPQLLKGVDANKDQSYVLWGIPAETLARTLFPLGEITKPEVRQIAARHRMITAREPESQEICFIPDNDYHRFLAENGPDAGPGPGEIVSLEGEVLGMHTGYRNYTIGQRRGLGLSNPEPLYVQATDPVTNRIVVASLDAVQHSGCRVGQLNWLVDPPQTEIVIEAKIRYNSPGARATLYPGKSSVEIRFEELQLAVTPGQSAVFYSGDQVLGGGIIEQSI